MRLLVTLVLGVALICFEWVFPWIAGELPINEQTVGPPQHPP